MYLGVMGNINPSGICFFRLILEDFYTHGKDPLSQGFWALLVHRFFNQLNDGELFFIRFPIRIFSLILMRAVEWFTGITLLPSTRIGRRVRIWHHSGIIVNAESIGDEVIIRQNTTIGQKSDSNRRPIIRDRVDIGCGAVLIGAIEVGEGAVIGANSVVVKDVSPGSTVVGVPARNISRK
jgi:serine O-acetyltransferase